MTLIGAQRGKRDSKGREPDHAGAIAVVRVGQRTADEGVGEQRDADPGGEFGNVRWYPVMPRQQQQYRQQRDGEQGQRIMQGVDGGEGNLAALLARRPHVFFKLRRKVVDDEISVPDPVHHAFAGVHGDQLPGGGRGGGLNLQSRIFEQAVERDLFHLFAEPGKTAEFVEQLAAPEPDVGIIGKLILVGAETQRRIGAVLVEVFLDDAVLQHAAERQRESAGRPRHLLGHDVIGGERHHNAEH